MGSRSGSAPELSLCCAGVPPFFHSLGKSSLTAVQNQGLILQTTAGRVSTRSTQSPLPGGPQTPIPRAIALGVRTLTPTRAAGGEMAHALHALRSFHPS